MYDPDDMYAPDPAPFEKKPSDPRQKLAADYHYGGSLNMFAPDQHDPQSIYWSVDTDTAVDRYGTESAPDRYRGDERPSPLDSAEMDGLHSRLMGHYFRELDRQADERASMEMDEDIYDNIQWTQEEETLLEERGQVPVTFNITAVAVNWITGTQRRNPMDYKLLPRSKEGLRHAEAKTKILKYLSDVHRSQMHWSLAFSDAAKVGVGWMEAGYSADSDTENVYDRRESWRNILWDTVAVEPDLSDARYIIRTKWTDVDRAHQMFPDRKEIIDLSSEYVWQYGPTLDSSGDEAMDRQEEYHFDSSTQYIHASYAGRSRVRLFECWYRQPMQVPVLDGGDFHGEILDPWSEGHINCLNNGSATIVNRLRERVMVAIFTTRGLMLVSESPYRHNKYPFTPIWGNRRGRDGMPYGLIRNVRDIQRDINKRFSKSLHHLNSNRVIYEEGSVEDEERLREEAARPDAMISYKRGHPPPVFDTGADLAAAQVELMGRDIMMIQQVSGITDELVGRTTNTTSGKAIIARQEQGHLATAHFFDNLKFARQCHGEKMLSLIEQYMTKSRQFRVINERGSPEFMVINTPDDDGDDNHITATKADFVIDEDASRATIRQAQAEVLLSLLRDLAPVVPQIVTQLLDLVVESMDLPKQGEIVRRIRQITGVMDPDADLENPDPETAQMMQVKMLQSDMAMRAAAAELAEKEGRAQETMAKARKLLAESISAENSLTKQQIEYIQTALSAAETLIGAPGSGPVADQILSEARAQAAASQQPLQPAPQEQQVPEQTAADPAQQQVPRAPEAAMGQFQPETINPTGGQDGR